MSMYSQPSMPAPQALDRLGLHARHAQQVLRIRHVGRQLRELRVQMRLEAGSVSRPKQLHGKRERKRKSGPGSPTSCRALATLPLVVAMLCRFRFCFMFTFRVVIVVARRTAEYH